MSDKAAIEQKACSLFGTANFLSIMSGDFYILLHCYLDCVNTFMYGPFDVSRKQLERFFYTNYSELDIIDGTTTERLGNAARALGETHPDKPIIVLTSCAVEMIGDDVRAELAAAEEETGAKFILIRTSGLGVFTISGILDKLASEILELAHSGEVKQTDSVNLVGIAPEPEFEEMFNRLGLKINTCIHEGSALDDWLNIPRGALNVVFDRAQFPSFLEKARDDFGVPFLEVDAPFGVKASVAFYRKVAEAMKVPSEKLVELDEIAKPHTRLIAKARPQFEGLSLGYNLCSIVDFSMRPNTRLGLPDLKIFEELGFAAEFLYQGAKRQAHLDRVSRVVKEAGFDHPVCGFNDTFLLSPLLKERGYALTYCADFLVAQARNTGVGFLRLHSLEPGLQATERNIRRIQIALDRR